MILTVDDDVYAIDGKRVRQPITDDDGKTRFVGLVSVFAQTQGTTVDLAALTTTETSELKVVQYRLEKLHLTGVVLTLDALHAQKKHCRSLLKGAIGLIENKLLDIQIDIEAMEMLGFYLRIDGLS